MVRKIFLAIALLAVLITGCQLSNANLPNSKAVDVAEVLDGDTLTLITGETIRLCGIDAPEQQQPLGKESKEKLRSLIASAGNEVIVFGDSKDRYGRTVAEVFIADPTPTQPEQEQLLNYEMVAAGMAYRYAPYSDTCPNGAMLTEAEHGAQSQRLGVWSNPNAVKPWDYRRATRSR